MPNLDRRDFLKLFGAAGTSVVLGGCSEPTRHLFPYINSPEDVVPGKASYYATTCRECPAGCGMLAKNREGRVVKVEGNPAHPISAGKLCMRGQASLHGLYNPDRFRGPMLRKTIGEFEPITWEAGEALLTEKLIELVQNGRGDRIVFLTGLNSGSLKDLIGHWLSEMGQLHGHIIYEPYAYEPLRKANQVVFGQDSVPTYNIAAADFLISFNAGFLETWLSNLEYARHYGSFHPLKGDHKNTFIFVGPRLSMTANNADLWIPTRPGTEYAVGLGIIREILDGNKVPGISKGLNATLSAMTANWPLEKAALTAGCDPKLIQAAASAFSKAERPLAIAEGLSLSIPNATETAVAANLLCALKPASLGAIDFNAASSYTQTARAETIKDLADRMRAGEVDLLLCHGVNPVFSLPKAMGFAEALKSVPTVVSFSHAEDETTPHAHLVLPTNYSFEAWGDYSPRPGITGFLQPVMGPVFDTKQIGDVLISTGRKVKGDDSFPWKDFYEALQGYWTTLWQNAGGIGSFDTFWQDTVKRGGYWTSVTSPPPSVVDSPDFAFPEPRTAVKSGQELPLAIYPTIQFFDGRQANHMWVQEVPDPMTQVTWGGWIEIHPETAKRLHINKADLLRVNTQYGILEIPALPVYTVPEGVVCHTRRPGAYQFRNFCQWTSGQSHRTAPV